ncbi:MAG TPA: glycosyltransferase family 2 protein [bacterium]|nr:glycosyltransferase family 2 protein [bacterium]
MTRTAPVTVVIPAFDAGAFLRGTLDAVLSQTTPPEQVVVVDDGSSDDTAAIAERMQVTLVRQQQQGPGAARNRGLELAKTEFVAFCDADDWYVPDKLERGIARLEDLGAACLATDAWIVAGDRIEGRKNENRPVPEVLTLEHLLLGNPIICSTVIARREAVEQVGGFDASEELIASEDYDLWLRMAMREPIAYWPRAMSFYRVHAGSLSANTRFLRGVDAILERVAAHYEGEPHFQNLIRRRRAGVRLDVAWDLLNEGRRDEARAMIADSWRMTPTWKGLRMRLRSMLKR